MKSHKSLRSAKYSDSIHRTPFNDIKYLNLSRIDYTPKEAVLQLYSQRNWSILETCIAILKGWKLEIALSLNKHYPTFSFLSLARKNNLHPLCYKLATLNLYQSISPLFLYAFLYSAQIMVDHISIQKITKMVLVVIIIIKRSNFIVTYS